MYGHLCDHGWCLMMQMTDIDDDWWCKCLMIDIDDAWCLMIDAEDDWWWMMSLVAGVTTVSYRFFDESQILQIYTSFEWLAHYPQSDPLKGALRHLGHPSRVSLNQKRECFARDDGFARCCFYIFSSILPGITRSFTRKKIRVFDFNKIKNAVGFQYRYRQTNQVIYEGSKLLKMFLLPHQATTDVWHLSLWVADPVRRKKDVVREGADCWWGSLDLEVLEF